MLRGRCKTPHKRFFPEQERTLLLLLKRLVNTDGYSRDGVTLDTFRELSILFDRFIPNPDNVISEIYFDWDGLVYNFVVTQDDRWLYFFPYYPDTRTYALKAQEI